MRYFFFTLHRTPKRDTVSDEFAQEILKKHTEYFKRLGKEGRCLVAGPFANQKGELGAGCYIFSAETEEQAKNMASEDPLVAEGLYEFKIYEWIKVVPEEKS
ncbi:MAG: YciI family protein [Pyrinomonadaceae bacterium]|nr:YciI family protein [Pyrinomonadaceae bacterium]MCX7639397.1 YciI family protein [Pyrinomonadaceae bacterium]MDW8304553.1 YciI family protein [Acidobacteriota bacterium]